MQVNTFQPADNTPTTEEVKKPKEINAKRNLMPSFLKRIDKKTLKSVLATLVMVIGLASVVTLVQRQQDIRQKAANADVSLSYILSSNNVEMGETFSAQISMNTGTNQVTATELEVKVDPSIFEIVSLVAMSPNMFDHANSPYGDLTVTELAASNVDNSTGTATLALGVPCDPCWINTDPGDGTAQCQTNPPAQCYPTITSTSGLLATLTLKVIDTRGSEAPVGDAGVDFGQGVQIAATYTDIADNVNVYDNSNSQPTTVTVKASCNYANEVSTDNTVLNSDIQQFANQFGKMQSDPSSGYDPHFDPDKDGMILNSDIQQVANYFGVTCQ